MNWKHSFHDTDITDHGSFLIIKCISEKSAEHISALNQCYDICRFICEKPYRKVFM